MVFRGGEKRLFALILIYCFLSHFGGLRAEALTVKTQANGIMSQYDPDTGLTTISLNPSDDNFSCDNQTDGLIVKFNANSSLHLRTKTLAASALTENEVKEFFRKKNLAKKSKLRIQKLINDDLDDLQQKALHKNLSQRTKVVSRFNKLKTLRKQYNVENIFLIKFNGNCVDQQRMLDELNQDPLVEYAELNGKIEATQNDDDFYQSTGQYWTLGYDEMWGLKQIQADKAWDTTQGEGVVVAVVDTGVDYNHPDLWYNIWVNPQKVNDINSDGLINLDDVDLNHNKFIETNEIIPEMFGKDFVYGDSDPLDEYGHGTHVAGTIAATASNSMGIIGIAPQAKILPIQVLGKTGSGSFTGIIQAVNYLANLTATNPELSNLVTNNSYGGTGYSKALADAFKLATGMGVINVAAAGNNDSDAIDFTPANLDTVITVGATGYNSKKASFSNFGNVVDVSAPGGGDNSSSSQRNILSTISFNSELLKVNPSYQINDPDGSNYVYARLAGTSMASPHVAGVAALVKSQHPEFNFEEVRDIIVNSARVFNQDIGKPMGKGIVDANAALNVGIPYPQAKILNLTSSINGNHAFALLADKSSHGAEINKIEFEWSYDQINWQTILVNGVSPNLSAEFDTTKVNQTDIFFRLRVTDNLGQISTDEQKTTINNFELTYPLSGDIVNKYDLLGLRASFKTANIKNFHALYSTEASPNQWLEDVSLIDTSKIGNKFTDQQIATLDSSKLNSDQIYQVKLAVEFDHGLISETVPAKIYIDSKLKKGFPIYSSDTSSLIRSGLDVVVADIDNDSEQEIIKIFPDSSTNPDSLLNMIRVFKANGQELWSRSFNYMNNLLAFDGNNDGKSEIYFTAVLDKRTYSLCTLDSEGNLKNKFPTGDLLGARSADIDKDSIPEIVAMNPDLGTNSYRIVVIDPISGNIKYSLKPNPAVTIYYPYYFTVANLDSDPESEIVYHTGDFSYDKLSAVNLDGSLVSAWPVNWQENYVSTGNINSADLDNDGLDEIIADAGLVSRRAPGSYTYFPKVALLSHDGVLKNNQLLEANPESDYSFIDIDNNGNKDIVFTSNHAFDIGKIHAFDKDGFALKNWPLVVLNTSLRRPNFENHIATILVADITKDNEDDLLISFAGLGKSFYNGSNLSDSGGIFAFDKIQNTIDLNPRAETSVLPMGSSGNLQSNGSKWSSYAGVPVITDLESNGLKDILIARDSEYGFENLDALKNYQAFLKPRAAIYAWQLPETLSTLPAPSPNQAPIANFSFSPSSPEIGSTVSFDASSSSDSDGTITYYSWDFDNDGITDNDSKNTSRVFSSAGVYTARLTVTDNLLFKNSISKTIIVKNTSSSPIPPTNPTPPSTTPPINQAPIANFSFSPTSPEIGSEISFDASLSKDLDGTINSYNWDFNNDGITDSTGKIVSKIFNTVGKFIVNLTVIDNLGARNSSSQEINVKDIVKPIDPKSNIEASFQFGVSQGQALTTIYKLKSKKPKLFTLMVFKTTVMQNQTMQLEFSTSDDFASLVKFSSFGFKFIPANQDYTSIKLQLGTISRFKQKFPNQKEINIPITVTDTASGYSLTSFIKVFL